MKQHMQKRRNSRLLLLAVLLLAFLPGRAQHDFRIKGFHLDLRIQVMPMPALRNFALELSKNGINTLVMEWEASYPYEKHAVISNRYAYQRGEITSFVRYCDSLGIDVIPLQQSFGHVEYILRHPRYKELREDKEDFSQVNPIREAQCKALFTDLFKDMISTHRSKYFHIGGDETYLLGHGEESKKKVAAVGKGRLYGDYIKMLCETVVSLGKIPVVWADIALKYPDALEGLPKETVFVDWNYGWSLDRFGDHQKLMESGFEIWGAPALRSAQDNYFLTDWQKHFNNLHSFVPDARRLGYTGMIMTSWSTSGIYSRVKDSHSETEDLYAIRRVYPLSGFDMLVSAYFASLRQQEGIVIADFVRQYANRQYGFTPQQATVFWNALKRAPLEVVQGQVQGSSINALIDSAQLSNTELKQLKPLRNAAAYAHYQLMSDIRMFYLRCMQVEIQLNDSNYTRDKAPALLAALRTLQPEVLNKRFAALNRGWLYPAEIAEENRVRNMRYYQLKNKIGHERAQ